MPVLLKLILTGCCLVARTVKVLSTDLEHRLTSVVTAIYYGIYNTLLVFFLGENHEIFLELDINFNETRSRKITNGYCVSTV